MKIDRTSY